MAHYSRVLKVVIDAPPGLHDQELAFWRQRPALGVIMTRPGVRRGPGAVKMGAWET